MQLFPSLQLRDKQPEIMDDPALPADEHRAALRGLARINGLSRSDAIVWPAIERLSQEFGRPLRVLDVASGGGDVLARLQARATRANRAIEFLGVDVSPTAIAQARQTCPRVAFFAQDVLRDELPKDCDVVMSSLFLHHLGTEDAVLLLRRMAEAARHLVLVNDLVRSRIGYWLAWIGTRILSRSSVVHVDGPRSVAGAFTTAEALQLAQSAGLRGAEITRHWPCRFLLQWRRPP